MDVPAYNRRYRKTAHILAGFPAFLLKQLPFNVMILFGVAMVAASWALRPKWRWLRELAKPEDVANRAFIGARHYFVTVFLLIVIFGLRYSAIATAGWLALAWGDGAAALVGGQRSPRLPWSRHKTISGFVTCVLLVYCAILIAYLWTLDDFAWFSPSALVYFAVVSLIIGIAESVKAPIDDNYIVGLGTAVLLFAGTALFHLW